MEVEFEITVLEEESAEFTGLLTRRRGGTEGYTEVASGSGLRPAGRIEQDQGISDCRDQSHLYS